MPRIDLNLDAGEDPAGLLDGREEELYRWVTSVSIACGGHAGDENTMRHAVQLAMRAGLRIGAHPSYPDRKGFGREVMKLTPDQLQLAIADQVEGLIRICDREGGVVTHVKPHGALYNQAAQDPVTAQAVIAAIRAAHPRLRVMGLAGSPFLSWCVDAGLSVLAEGFCDRTYEDDGSLRPRRFADAMIDDPDRAGEQAVHIVKQSYVGSISGRAVPLSASTLCIHGDSPNALTVVQAVRRHLEQAQVEVKAYI